MELEFYNACEQGKLDDIKNLINQNIDLCNWQNSKDDMRTPLMVACASNQIDIVKFLLKQPFIDINQQKVDDVTSLIIVCCCEYNAIVELLIKDNRVVVTAIDIYHQTSLWLSCYWENLKTINVQN